MTNKVNLDIKQLLNDEIDIRGDYSQTNLMKQINDKFTTDFFCIQAFLKIYV